MNIYAAERTTSFGLSYSQEMMRYLRLFDVIVLLVRDSVRTSISSEYTNNNKYNR